MLVLSRKVGEAIVIDHDVRVVVLSVDRRGVRLGFEAPGGRQVLREELVLEVATENQRAAAPRLSDQLAGHLAPAPLVPAAQPDPTDR
ncbi:MAG: carbon storage regulator CsrA [Gemmatimonadota bacterium]|nr:carbon storage regulator CsrA [Gemmatimonadota bacterium]